MFLHYSQVDGAGRAVASPSDPVYLASIGKVDALVGQVLDAVRQRPQFAEEDWLTIMVTDHGGNGTAHGGQTDTMIIFGKRQFSRRGIVDEAPDNT